MKIYHGSIVTCNEQNTVAQYLVEDYGRIRYVGDQLPGEYVGAPVIPLGERALLPSFVDSHLHFLSFALFNSGLNVMSARSNDELLQMIRDYLPKTKAKIVITFGASLHSVREKVLVNRSQLDKISKVRPIMVVKYDGHACIVNQALLDKLGSRIASLRGYNAESGEMNQEAFFAVTDYVSGTISIPSLIENLQHAIDFLAARGIGMMHTVSGVGFPKDIDVDLERWVGRSAQSGYQTRLFFQTMETAKVAKRKLPRIGGCFATALDGCFGSLDAALLRPYEGTANTGVLYYSDEQVIAFCKKANRLGLQIEMHAIGDAAFRQATKALKAALDDFPRSDHRHGIIHACLPTDEGIKICSDYQIHIPLQTSFLNWPQEPDWYLRSIMAERESQLNPLRTFVNRGIVISAGSDAPCTTPDPMLWVHNACNHPSSGESLTVYEALRMATYAGYWTSFDERERGTLEPGKIADMVILSGNPYSVNSQELNSIKVEQLILSGQDYQKQSQNILALVLKGIMSRGKI